MSGDPAHQAGRREGAGSEAPGSRSLQQAQLLVRRPGSKAGLEVPPESPGWGQSGVFPGRPENAIHNSKPAARPRCSQSSRRRWRRRARPGSQPRPCTTAATPPRAGFPGQLDRFLSAGSEPVSPLLCPPQSLAPEYRLSLSVCLSLWV